VSSLHTARLILRPQVQEDAHALFDILNDAEAMRFWNRPALARLAVADELVAGQIAAQDQGLCRYWTLWHDGGAIGSVDLSLIENGSAELGFLLRRDHWGLGLATEAARAAADFGLGQLGLARLAAAAHAENRAARRVLEKTGFALVGTRDARQADGRTLAAAFYLRVRG
jgi:RimJ/RimL family protein N-acetyltransferase